MAAHNPIDCDSGNGIKKTSKYLDFVQKAFAVIGIIAVLIGLVVAYRIKAFDEKCIEPIRQECRGLRKDYDLHVAESCVVKRDVEKKVDYVEFKAEIDKMHITLDAIKTSIERIEKNQERYFK
jgi:hypothetical protein